MSIFKFHTAFFILSFLCLKQLNGQVADKYSNLLEPELESYKSLTGQGIDTILFFSFQSFAYSVKDTNFRKMILWQKNGKTFKSIMKDSTFSSPFATKNNSLLKPFFYHNINSSRAGKIKSDYWSRRRMGWINPLSNFHSITFFYQKGYYSEWFPEGSGVYGNKKMRKLLKRELAWLNMLKAEMYSY